MNNFFIETSNNVQINVKPASVAHRLLAYLLDLLFVFVFEIFVSLTLGLAGFNPNSSIVFMLFMLIPVFFYNLLFEIFNKGRSFGKMILKLQVIREDGQSPSVGHYLLRWLLRPVDNFFYGAVAVLSIVLTKKGQRIGDLAAGTMVIRHKEEVSLNELTQFIANDSYVPTYNNVSLLSQTQINTIKEVLLRYKTSGDMSVVIVLCAKVKTILNIDSKESDYKILYTVVKDYENYFN